MDVKTCRKCGQEKPLTDFYKSKQVKSGHCAQCKTCMAAYYRDWSKRNIDRLRAGQAAWRKNNPGRVAAYRDAAARREVNEST